MIDNYYGVNYDNIHNNITKVSNYWGKNIPMMTIEELSELSVAISHFERGKVIALDDIIVELRDVYISLYALMEHYDIDPEYVERKMNEKLIDKDEEAHKKFRYFIKSCFLGYPITTETRALNALIRSGCDRIEKLRASIAINEENWWKDIRGLGKQSADVISEAVRKKYSV